MNEVLSKYFQAREIYDVRCILMPTSPGHKGGDVSYQRFKHNAERLLNRENDILVTSLIDFFRLKTDFPKLQEANTRFSNDKIARVAFLESAISENINNTRLIPYIQLHEFEGLLFSSIDGFEYLPDIPEINRNELRNAAYTHDNPELLNDGPNTAPSKRLENLIPGYQKTFHGPLIAEIVTIDKIMERCDRFREWIETLVFRMKEI
ncbi:MAG: DUF4276 family protein [Bacteroidales bacterium]|nr:DUF4276 family protein [Bacteroidales bacterium]